MSYQQRSGRSWAPHAHAPSGTRHHVMCARMYRDAGHGVDRSGSCGNRHSCVPQVCSNSAPAITNTGRIAGETAVVQVHRCPVAIAVMIGCSLQLAVSQSIISCVTIVRRCTECHWLMRFRHSIPLHLFFSVGVAAGPQSIIKMVYSLAHDQCTITPIINVKCSTGWGSTSSYQERPYVSTLLVHTSPYPMTSWTAVHCIGCFGA